MPENWAVALPPAELHLEDGATVAHAVGVRVFNYYDRKAGHIERVATYPSASTMPVHERDGAAWWVTVRHDDGSSALLDQSRLCSIEHAKARGWLKDTPEDDHRAGEHDTHQTAECRLCVAQSTHTWQP